MARPKKTGLDYFPLDVDFFNDDKIVCIAGEFGAIGELVAVKLLCKIYRNGYYAAWDDAAKFKMMRDLSGLTADRLDQIVERLASWGFFDPEMLSTSGVLTSKGIQERYFEAVRRRLSSDTEYPYLLIEVKPRKTSAPQSPSTPKNQTEQNDCQNQPEIEPLKPTRQIAESKENEKDFLSIFYQREHDDDINRWAATLEISRDRFDHIARLVVKEWEDTGVRHNSYSGASRHLYNHVRKKLRETPTLRTSATPRQIERIKADRQAEQAKRDEEERIYRQSVEETGMNGWQQWCAQRGLNPQTTSASDFARL